MKTVLSNAIWAELDNERIQVHSTALWIYWDEQFQSLKLLTEEQRDSIIITLLWNSYHYGLWPIIEDVHSALQVSSHNWYDIRLRQILAWRPELHVYSPYSDNGMYWYSKVLHAYYEKTWMLPKFDFPSKYDHSKWRWVSWGIFMEISAIQRYHSTPIAEYPTWLFDEDIDSYESEWFVPTSKKLITTLQSAYPQWEYIPNMSTIHIERRKIPLVIEMFEQMNCINDREIHFCRTIRKAISEKVYNYKHI